MVVEEDLDLCFGNGFGGFLMDLVIDVEYRGIEPV